MENKQKNWTRAIIFLIIGAGLIFFGLHFSMPDNHEKPAMTQEKEAFKNITAEQLRTMLDNKDFLLVNVHSPYMGEIEKTDYFIFANDIKNNLDKFPDGKDTKIVLYCRSGGMSRMAAQDLADMGYANVFNLLGGMNGWEQAGYKLDFVEANRK
ncbi:MAG: rhodanese-like domain-containing protein [bacterium]|nr:rhodanese-like domain-containing protein [bacterium]